MKVLVDLGVTAVTFRITRISAESCSRPPNSVVELPLTERRPGWKHELPNLAIELVARGDELAQCAARRRKGIEFFA